MEGQKICETRAEWLGYVRWLGRHSPSPIHPPRLDEVVDRLDWRLDPRKRRLPVEMPARDNQRIRLAAPRHPAERLEALWAHTAPQCHTSLPNVWFVVG